MTGTRVVASGGRRGNRAGIGCLIAMLILVGAGVCPAGNIDNPSFEGAGDAAFAVPYYWTATGNGAFISYRTNLWCTDGNYSATSFSKPGVFINGGVSAAFSQGVNLADVGCIEFDVKLAAYGVQSAVLVERPGEFANFAASVLIDGEVVWRQTAGGIYLNQRANVPPASSAWPWRRIELRTTALDGGGTFNLSYCTLWDNLRLVEACAAPSAAVIRLEPATLNLSSEGRWVTCYIELGEDYDIRTIDGTTVTLNDIPAYVGESGWAAPQANDENVADFDGDGILERMVKFDRAAVHAMVTPSDATLTITIRGQLTGGTPVESDGAVAKGLLTAGTRVEFDGTTVVRVVNTGAKK